MNKRIRFLLGFGGLAVVLLVVFNMWYPPVSDEAATGAVVAVKKHRQQQIAAQDVVLGDEAARKESQVLYADYLSDAAKLENVSADLALALRNRQAAGADLAAMRLSLEAASKSLEAQSQELGLRALESARAELAAMEAILAAAPKELEMRADLDAALAAVRKSLESKSALDSAQMDAIGAQLAAASQQLEARVLPGASAGSMTTRLDALRRDLENKGSSLDAMKAELAAVGRELGKSAAMQTASLEHQTAYLAALSKENKALESARATLEAASRNLAAKNALESADAQALEQASRMLASQASDLENRAVANLESRSALLTLENKSLESASSSLGLVSRAIENRSDLEAAARQDLDLGLKTAVASLASRSAALDAGALAAMRLELASLNRHLDNRASLESRWAEAAMLGRASNLESLRSYLGKMSLQLEKSSSLEATGALDNRKALDNKNVDLAAQARALENRASVLSSASKE